MCSGQMNKFYNPIGHITLSWRLKSNIFVQVVYLSEKNKGRPEFIASTKLLTMAGVEIR